MDLKEILFILSLCAPLFAVVIGRKSRSHPLFYYVLLASLIDWATTIWKLGFNQNIQWAGNFFLALEFFFFALFFIRVLGLEKKIWPWVVAIGLEAWFISMSIQQSFQVFYGFGAGILCIIYLLLCVASYRKLLTGPPISFIDKSSVFWITTGIFLYAAISSLVFIFISSSKLQQESLAVLWQYFYIIINMVRYVLIGVGLKLYAKYGV